MPILQVIPMKHKPKRMEPPYTQDRASDLYPSVLIEGHLLHIFEEDGEWKVWLNTEDCDFTGLCIGIGETRDAAVQQAVAVLEACAEHLQEKR